MQERARLACSIVQTGLQALEDDERHLLEAMYIHTTAGRAERLAEELGETDSRSVYKRTEKRPAPVHDCPVWGDGVIMPPTLALLNIRPRLSVLPGGPGCGPCARSARP